MNKNKSTVMKIDIWSDVRCPFCYIGKKKFETALNKFPHKDNVEVIWHSFQLDPGMQTQPGKNAYDYFSEAKGLSRPQAVGMHNRAALIGREAGLTFNFDNLVVANSFNAHRFIQLAKTKGLANDAEEQLFKAYFTEGKNIDDTATLAQIGISIGIDAKEAAEALTSGAFAAEVERDESAARTIGIRGVPFFVFNYQHAVSGAQSPDTFLQVLERSWSEFENAQENLVKVNSGI
jgi:protein disulfide-isomerase